MLVDASFLSLQAGARPESALVREHRVESDMEKLHKAHNSLQSAMEL